MPLSIFLFILIFTYPLYSNDNLDKQNSCESALMGESLFEAIKANNLNKVEDLLSAGANVNLPDNKGHTALIKAVNRNYDNYMNYMRGSKQDPVEMVTILIKAGADVNYENDFGYTALIWASNGHPMPKTVEALIAARANVNHQAKDGKTALKWASYMGNLETVKLLIAAGADVNIRGNDKETALSLAENYRRNSEIVNVLKEAGATE